MKRRTVKPMTAKQIEKIRGLMDAGMGGQQIGAMLDIGKSTAQRYVTILDALHRGAPIPIREELYNRTAVMHYCQLHGIEPGTDTVTQMTMTDAQPEHQADAQGTDRQRDRVEVFRRMADALRSLADCVEHLGENA